MLHWIDANLGTILITLLLLVLTGGIVKSLVRKKKQGKCNCNCAHCAMQKACHTPK